MAFKFEVHGKIARPIAVVFNAVTDPKELSSYFTTGGASARLARRHDRDLGFRRLPGRIPGQGHTLVPNERIEFSWEAGERGYDTQVVMTFEASTRHDAGPDRGVRVARYPKGQESSYGNCIGWTQMLCCLKAWVEHRINLRQGFF